MKASNRKGARPLAAPDLPANLATPLFPVGDLTTGEQYAEVALVDWDGSGQSADDLHFDAVLLERANLSGTRLRRLRMRDVRLLKTDLSNAEWPQATLDRVEILAGRLTGLKALDAKFADLRVVGCKVDLAQFRHASLRDVRFEECVLREADFQGAHLSNVSFQGCDLQGANFTAAKLDQADFRGARLEGLSLRPEDLKGMIIDQGQAMELATYFAQSLGVTVADR